MRGDSSLKLASRAVSTIVGHFFRVRCCAMPLVVKPSEVTEGNFQASKALRGFVLQKKKKTNLDGKTVVEIHVVAAPDTNELYLFEAWGAVALRLDKIEHKVYDFTGFIAKSSLNKAMWTPSTAPTWGLLTTKSQWSDVADARGFPDQFPTMSLAALTTVKSSQQVCVQGVLQTLL